MVLRFVPHPSLHIRCLVGWQQVTGRPLLLCRSLAWPAHPAHRWRSAGAASVGGPTTSRQEAVVGPTLGQVLSEHVERDFYVKLMDATDVVEVAELLFEAYTKREPTCRRLPWDATSRGQFHQYCQFMAERDAAVELSVVARTLSTNQLTSVLMAEDWETPTVDFHNLSFPSILAPVVHLGQLAHHEYYRHLVRTGRSSLLRPNRVLHVALASSRPEFANRGIIKTCLGDLLIHARNTLRDDNVEFRRRVASRLLPSRSSTWKGEQNPSSLSKGDKDINRNHDVAGRNGGVMKKEQEQEEERDEKDTESTGLRCVVCIASCPQTVKFCAAHGFHEVARTPLKELTHNGVKPFHDVTELDECRIMELRFL